MADSATEIDLDSVIDRLLEGGWRVPVTRPSFGSCLQGGRGGVCKRHEHRPRWGVWKVVLREGLGRHAVESPVRLCGSAAMCWCGSVEKALRVEYTSLEQPQCILPPHHTPVFEQEY